MPRNAFDAQPAPESQKAAAKDKSKSSPSRDRSSSSSTRSKGRENLKDTRSERADGADTAKKRRRSSSASGSANRKRTSIRVKKRRTPARDRRSRRRRSSCSGRSESNERSRKSRSSSNLQLQIRRRDLLRRAKARLSPARRSPSPEPKKGSPSPEPNRTPARRTLRCQRSDEVRQPQGRGHGHSEAKSRRVVEVQPTLAPRQAKGIVHDVGFSVLYWGGAGKDRPWDFDNLGCTPMLCRQCDSVKDTWRGRFDNAQVTFRMCGAEGSGFKRYVHEFSMMSGKGVAEFHLSTFYRWISARGKKVLNERVVIGSMLEAYHGMHDPRECGIRASNNWGDWERSLRYLCKRFQEEAKRGGGKFCALVLDEHGSECRISDMLRVQGNSHIGRLLIVLGGPDGIAAKQAEDMRNVMEEYTDLPLFRCALPGGKMHSYYALSTLFMLHDQGLLLPFLSHLAGDHPQTPAHRRRENLDSVLSPMKQYPGNDEVRTVMHTSNHKDRLQSPEASGRVTLRSGPLVSEEVLARRAARFGGGLTSPEASHSKEEMATVRRTSPDTPLDKASSPPKPRTLSRSPKQRAPSAEDRAHGIAHRTPSPRGRDHHVGQSHTANNSSDMRSPELVRGSQPRKVNGLAKLRSPEPAARAKVSLVPSKD